LKADSRYVFEDEAAAGSEDHRVQDYLSLLLRGKWFIFASTVIAASVSVIYTLRTDSAYEATSMVLVNPRQSSGHAPLGNLFEGNDLAKVPNELVVLRSRGLALAVAEQLLKEPFQDETKKRKFPILLTSVDEDTQATVAGTDVVAGRLSGSVDFMPERDADIIRITARSGNPREAAAIANTYAEMYQEQSMNASRARSRSAREFLDSRLQEQRSTLAKAEESVKSFMESSGIVSLDGESSRLVGEMSQLEATRNSLDIDIETLSKKLASMEKELPAQEASAMSTVGQANDPYLHLMQEQLARLEVKRDVIIAQNDPKILGQEIYRRQLKDIEDQIATLKKNLQKRSNEVIQAIVPGQGTSAQADPVSYIRTLKQNILTTKVDIESLRARKEALDGLIREYDSRFQRLPTSSIELARRQRERLSSEHLYSLVEQKFNEAAIAEKSEFGYVDLLDRASIPSAPVSPNPKKNFLMGILAGLGLGVVVVFAREALDARVRTPEQLRRKGYSCLSEVAPMGPELRKLQHEGRIPVEVKRFDQHVWLIFYPLSFLAESYRRLRTTLLHGQFDKKLQVLVVTSASPGEGKTTTACNLAIAFAETKQPVLLIDADLRRPTVHTSFGIQSKPGLTDFLFDKATFDEIIQHHVVENLDVMSFGSVVRSPSRIIGSRTMRTLLEVVRKKYDWVIIDTPPLLVVNDALLLSALVDGTILTASAGTTRLSTLGRASEYLSHAGNNSLGVVLNMFDPRKAYGRYYGGYRYGHYGAKDRYYTSSESRGPTSTARNG
jgi:capsular exopolysaccharide synthesis family protein